MKNEAILAKQQIQATCSKSIQTLQHATKHVHVDVNTLTTMEPYLFNHILCEYDNLLMQNTILKIK
jgi:hypothetical protein